MLVLSRKSGESIVIGDAIEVVILGVRGNRVSVGVKAPPPVRVVRNELPRFDAEDHETLLPAAIGA